MIRKHIKYLAMSTVLLFALSGLTGCAAGTTVNETETASAAAVSGLFVQLAEYDSEDLETSWDTASAVNINLNGSSAEIDGSGAAVSNGRIMINAAGTYVLSGTLNDGQIIVAAGNDDLVRLVLNGVSLNCSDSAPIYIMQADKAIVTLAAGTVNSVTDGSVYSYATDEDEPDAAVFSKCDLTINGAGTLNVDANFNNGIGSKDDLVITGGTINVTAANDGLRGRDSVAVKDGSLTINAKGDGIQSNNDEDADKGWISLDGGTFNITTDNDGIQAETILQINGGEFSLTTGGGRTDTGSGRDGMPGGFKNAVTAEEDTESTKAIKGGTGVAISDGAFTIDAADDAIHSVDVEIKGGTFDIITGDDAIHADNSVTVDAGTIKVAASYEGIEGANITINGGDIYLIASDDGLNAAGGNDGSGQQGGDQFSAGGDYEVRITGGYIYMDAGGDGLDSNGALNISGGTIIVNGPVNDGNGALDYNGSAEITGGILVAAGSSGMAEAPEASSAQNSLLVYYTSAQAAGTLVNLSDAQGNSLLTFAPAKTYESIVISLPELQQGQTYTLSTGGSCSGENVNGLYTGGTYTGGTKLTDVTISSALTSISDDGSAATDHGTAGGGAPAGGGGPGGQRPGM